MYTVLFFLFFFFVKIKKFYFIFFIFYYFYLLFIFSLSLFSFWLATMGHRTCLLSFFLELFDTNMFLCNSVTDTVHCRKQQYSPGIFLLQFLSLNSRGILSFECPLNQCCRKILKVFIQQIHNLFIFTNNLKLQLEALTSVRNDLSLKLNFINLNHVCNLFWKRKSLGKYFILWSNWKR